jgi:phosphoglycerol transferase
MRFKKDRIKIIAIYIGVSILSILILFWVLKLWQADLRIPFAYYGDALFSGMIIKGIIDNGGYLRNPFVGMPTGAMMYDFTGSDSFHMLVVKIISLFTSDWALVMNIFFLLGSPLTTLCSLYVFRKFGFSYISSIAGSLLYTFLPYHFFRNVGHLFLAAYYIIPLMTMVILWVASGEILFSIRDLKSNILNGKLISSIFICLITASSGVYYAFFACIFLLIAGVRSFSCKKNIGPLFLSLFLIFIIFIAALSNLSPSIIYQYRNGKNIVFAKRPPQESENVGLKVTQLLLPVDGHRIALLAKSKETYNKTAPLINENRFSSLGIMGSVGFLILILALIFRNATFLKNEIIENLSFLNIMGVLYATIGGFGSLFSYMILSQFRSLNRISIYLAFFSLFTFVIILDKLHKKFATLRKASILYAGVIGAIIIFGILDQTTKYFVFPYDSIKKEYKNDGNFVKKIEALLPANSMIFQLPNMLFPETPPVHHVDGYQHLRGYLHSKTLRWSYGAMRGRDGDLWQMWVTSKPLNDFVEIISLAGFNGIYIDRYGYPDRGADLEKKLTILLNINPIVSDNNRLLFFDMRDFVKKVIGEYQNSGGSSFPGLKKLQQISLPIETKNIRYHIDIFTQNKNYIEIAGWAFINGESSENSKIYLGLRSDKNSYLINTNLNKRPDVTAYFKSLNFDDSGFSAIIAKEEIEMGTYRMGICIKQDDIEAFQYTGKYLTLQTK